MPPSMHFLTQAAPLPACLTPHIESEIQPLAFVESAARAPAAARERTTTNNAKTRFTFNLLLDPLFGPLCPPRTPAQEFCRYAYSTCAGSCFRRLARMPSTCFSVASYFEAADVNLLIISEVFCRNVGWRCRMSSRNGANLASRKKPSLLQSTNSSAETAPWSTMAA